MQIDVQEYLDLAEQTKQLVFFDIEATGLRGDYGSVLCASFKPYGSKPYSLRVKQVGNDKGLVREIKEELEKYHSWCTFYGKGFDIPMIQTRLLKWGHKPIQSHHHIDLFFTLKHHTVMSRKSMAQFAGLLQTGEQKMGVSPNVWSEIGYNPNHFKQMIERCESDVSVLEDVYKKTRHIIKDLKKQS